MFYFTCDRSLNGMLLHIALLYCSYRLRDLYSHTACERNRPAKRKERFSYFYVALNLRLGGISDWQTVLSIALDLGNVAV